MSTTAGTPESPEPEILSEEAAAAEELVPADATDDPEGDAEADVAGDMEGDFEADLGDDAEGHVEPGFDISSEDGLDTDESAEPEGWVEAESEGWVNPEGWADSDSLTEPEPWAEGWPASDPMPDPTLVAGDGAVTPRADEPGWRVLQRFLTPLDGHRGDSRALYSHGLMFDVNRYSCIIPEHHGVSFGSYFNAFPASYWRRWTEIDSVRLRLKVRGNGKVTVFRSTSAGMSWCERNVVFEGAEVHEVVIDLPLDPFIDGGWYWFDLLAFGGNDVVLEEGDWSGRSDKTQRGRVSVGITTFNRPDFCIDQIRNLGAHQALLAVLDKVYVVDQGTQRVLEHPSFIEASQGLGDKLTVIEQGNLGGSGGFARAMFETLEADDSDYLLLLDDDVVAEPEGITRAVTFADLSRQPVLVGGHMFSIFVRSVLHAFGEAVMKYRWMWGPAPHTQNAHDFGAAALAHTPWMHRRVDVDYNGWWMCLIPTEVLRDIGLALPMFIKWDDAEFGLRARERGYPTVSLPGFAVWHVPWHEKDDTIDWGAYYHARNRILSALLHSPYDHGGSLPRDSYAAVVKHALALQYSSAELILLALEDLFEGPEHMHRDIGTKLGEVRAMRAEFQDSKFITDLQNYPPIHGRKPPRRGKIPAGPTDMRGAAKLAAQLLPRHLSAMSAEATNFPQAALPHADQRWWRLAEYDSVLVSSADGSSAAWYRRDPERFRSLLRRGSVLHARLYREWSTLSERYRAAVPELASPEAWRKTFEESEARASRTTPPVSAEPGPHTGRTPKS